MKTERKKEEHWMGEMKRTCVRACDWTLLGIKVLFSQRKKKFTFFKKFLWYYFQQNKKMKKNEERIETKTK